MLYINCRNFLVKNKKIISILFYCSGIFLKTIHQTIVMRGVKNSISELHPKTLFDKLREKTTTAIMFLTLSPQAILRGGGGFLHL